MSTESAEAPDTTPHQGADRTWRIIRTKPEFLYDLQAMCKQAGAALYVPRRVRHSRVRRERVEDKPMFPGYAFLPLDQADLIGQIPTFRYQFVRRPGGFAWIGDSEMQIIQEEEGKLNQFEVDPKSAKGFSIDDRVRIVGDLFGTDWIVADKTENELVLRAADANWDISVSPDLVQHVGKRD